MFVCYMVICLVQYFLLSVHYFNKFISLLKTSKPNVKLTISSVEPEGLAVSQPLLSTYSTTLSEGTDIQPLPIVPSSESPEPELIKSKNFHLLHVKKKKNIQCTVFISIYLYAHKHLPIIESAISLYVIDLLVKCPPL